MLLQIAALLRFTYISAVPSAVSCVVCGELDLAGILVMMLLAAVVDLGAQLHLCRQPAVIGSCSLLFLAFYTLLLLEAGVCGHMGCMLMGLKPLLSSYSFVSWKFEQAFSRGVILTPGAAGALCPLLAV
jgi:hypothetical protein